MDDLSGEMSYNSKSDNPVFQRSNQDILRDLQTDMEELKMKLLVGIQENDDSYNDNNNNYNYNAPQQDKNVPSLEETLARFSKMKYARAGFALRVFKRAAVLKAMGLENQETQDEQHRVIVPQRPATEREESSSLVRRNLKKTNSHASFSSVLTPTIEESENNISSQLQQHFLSSKSPRSKISELHERQILMAELALLEQSLSQSSTPYPRNSKARKHNSDAAVYQKKQKSNSKLTPRLKRMVSSKSSSSNHDSQSTILRIPIRHTAKSKAWEIMSSFKQQASILQIEASTVANKKEKKKLLPPIRQDNPSQNTLHEDDINTITVNIEMDIESIPVGSWAYTQFVGGLCAEIAMAVEAANQRISVMDVRGNVSVVLSIAPDLSKQEAGGPGCSIIARDIFKQCNDEKSKLRTAGFLGKKILNAVLGNNVIEPILPVILPPIVVPLTPAPPLLPSTSRHATPAPRPPSHLSNRSGTSNTHRPPTSRSVAPKISAENQEQLSIGNFSPGSGIQLGTEFPRSVCDEQEDNDVFPLSTLDESDEEIFTSKVCNRCDESGMSQLSKLAGALRLENKPFEDADFPADYSSIFRDGADGQFFNRLNMRTDIVWKRPDEIGNPGESAVVFSDRVDAGNTKLGSIGDSFILAALMSLQTKPKLVEDLVVGAYTDVGLFAVKLYYRGQWRIVWVDDRFPCYRDSFTGTYVPCFCCYSETKELWAMVVEKAFAKIMGCYEALHSPSDPADVMTYLTGGTYDSLNIDIQIYYDQMQREALFEELLVLLRKGNNHFFAQARINATPLPGKTQCFVHRDSEHSSTSYCIQRVGHYGPFRLLNLRNPWATKCKWAGDWSESNYMWKRHPEIEQETGFKPSDGSFWISWEDFIVSFSFISSCQEVHEEWTSFWYSGKWTKAISAGGKPGHHPTWYFNPTFLVRIQDEESFDVPISIALETRDGRKNGNGPLWTCISLLPVRREANSGHLQQVGFDEVIMSTHSHFARFWNVVCTGHAEFLVNVATWHPGVEEEFWLRIDSTQKLKITPIEPYLLWDANEIGFGMSAPPFPALQCTECFADLAYKPENIFIRGIGWHHCCFSCTFCHLMLDPTKHELYEIEVVDGSWKALCQDCHAARRRRPLCHHCFLPLTNGESYFDPMEENNNVARLRKTGDIVHSKCLDDFKNGKLKGSCLVCNQAVFGLDYVRVNQGKVHEGNCRAEHCKSQMIEEAKLYDVVTIVLRRDKSLEAPLLQPESVEKGLLKKYVVSWLCRQVGVSRNRLGIGQIQATSYILCEVLFFSRGSDQEQVQTERGIEALLNLCNDPKSSLRLESGDLGSLVVSGYRENIGAVHFILAADTAMISTEQQHQNGRKPSNSQQFVSLFKSNPSGDDNVRTRIARRMFKLKMYARRVGREIVKSRRHRQSIRPCYFFRDKQGENDIEYIASILKIKGKLFDDPDFPPSEKSIWRDPSHPNTDILQGDISCVVWKRLSDIGDANEITQLFAGGFNASDINRGQLGNGYLLSALVSITHRFDLIQELIIDTFGELGIFGVKLYVHGQWRTVIVDDQFPCFKSTSGMFRPWFSRYGVQKQAWVMIVEKAFAKLLGSYEAIEGGEPSDALAYLTGGSCITHTFNDPTVLARIKNDRLFEELTVLTQIRDDSEPCCFLCCGSESAAQIQAQRRRRQQQQHQQSTAVVSMPNLTQASPRSLVNTNSRDMSALDHSFSIYQAVRVGSKHKMLLLFNPWTSLKFHGKWTGSSELWKAHRDVAQACDYHGPREDGAFWVSWDEFLRNFTFISYCHMVPRNWCSVSAAGRWISGYSAGGPGHCSSWKYNPTFFSRCASTFRITMETRDPKINGKGPTWCSISILPVFRNADGTISRCERKNAVISKSSCQRSWSMDVDLRIFKTSNSTLFLEQHNGAMECVIVIATWHAGVEDSFWLRFDSRLPHFVDAMDFTEGPDTSNVYNMIAPPLPNKCIACAQPIMRYSDCRFARSIGWHEECFYCSDCGCSLIGKQLGAELVSPEEDEDDEEIAFGSTNACWKGLCGGCIASRTAQPCAECGQRLLPGQPVGQLVESGVMIHESCLEAYKAKSMCKKCPVCQNAVIGDEFYAFGEESIHQGDCKREFLKRRKQMMK